MTTTLVAIQHGLPSTIEPTTTEVWKEDGGFSKVATIYDANVHVFNQAIAAATGDVAALARCGQVISGLDGAEFLYWSDDAGETWDLTAYAVFPAQAYHSEWSFAVIGATIYGVRRYKSIVSAGVYDTDIQLFSSTDGSWTPLSTILSEERHTSEDIEYAHLRIDEDDTFHCYLHRSDGAPGANKLYHTKSADGVTWSVPELIYENEHYWYPRISTALEHDGLLFYAFGADSFLTRSQQMVYHDGSWHTTTEDGALAHYDGTDYLYSYGSSTHNTMEYDAALAFSPFGAGYLSSQDVIANSTVDRFFMCSYKIEDHILTLTAYSGDMSGEEEIISTDVEVYNIGFSDVVIWGDYSPAGGGYSFWW